jgi:hypothetical protein
MKIAITKWALFIAVAVCGILVASGVSSNRKVLAAGPCPTSQEEIYAATGKFVDRATIVLTIGGKDFTFVDSNIKDNSNGYTVQNSDCGGQFKLDDTTTDQNHLDGFPASKGPTVTGVLRMEFLPANGGKVPTQDPVNIPISSDHGNELFVWRDAGTIVNLAAPYQNDISKNIFTKATGVGVSSQLFVGPVNGNGECGPLLIVSSDNKSVRPYFLHSGGGNPLTSVNDADATILKPLFPAQCGVDASADLANHILFDASGKITSADYPVGHQADIIKLAGTGGDNTSADNTATSCANAPGADGFEIRWIECPIIEVMDRSMTFLDSQLQSLLRVHDPNDPSYAPSSELHTAWGRIRNIALIILIPIMLVMVIGTALGVSFLDAYTVRRAMPRFLIAIVFISVSWYITSFMINLTNVVGTGILGVMTQPFGGPNTSLAQLINPTNAGLTTAGGLAIFGGLLVAGVVSFGIIISYAFIGLLVLFIGFLLLSIRQLLILVLVLFAPLAILSWIFPNNDKLWKLWYKTFSDLLLLFPLIMILIGGGKIIAYVVSKS